jgi:hypothetical protein
VRKKLRSEDTAACHPSRELSIRYGTEREGSRISRALRSRTLKCGEQEGWAEERRQNDNLLLKE